MRPPAPRRCCRTPVSVAARHEGGPPVTIAAQRVPRGSGWMSIQEASNLMGVSPATLRRWSDAGRIRTFTTPGGHRRFSRAAVDALLPDDATTAPQDQPTGASTPTCRGSSRSTRGRAGGRVSRSTRSPRHWSRRPSAERRWSGTTRSAGPRWPRPAVRCWRPDPASVFARRSKGCCRCAADVSRRSAIRARPAETTGTCSVASVETLTSLLDRLLCHAMRAHEAASGRS